ncbi:hypothetical protein OPS25_14525 [Alteromonas ponticola]|uniref:Sulfotransferase family protein n=1 Tax=Alteromonas aquimaris TaxID=2998417 RepID=A0ABT3PAB3_9ALTE|nr:hypothetical protein [Alteromonas aquimaris]MCW8109718.1 hypothetical protein [Alteromonas aquimaris]
MLDVWTLKKYFSPTNDSIEHPNRRVRWLVHHVPKTAGTSLRATFEKSLGSKAIYGVYIDTGANLLSRGKPIQTPWKAEVLFGHYSTHKNQGLVYPNAKRLTWVRDPLERMWSHIGHVLALKQPMRIYRYLKRNFLDNGIVDREEMFEMLVKEKSVPHLTNIYSLYFKNVELKTFDFVGSVHRNQESLNELQEILGCQLTETNANVRNIKQDFPSSLRKFEGYFDKEFQIIGKYL